MANPPTSEEQQHIVRYVPQQCIGSGANATTATARVNNNEDPLTQLLLHADQRDSSNEGVWRPGDNLPAKLDLHDLNLSTLPYGFGFAPLPAKWHKIIKLELDHNALTELPPLTHMPALQILLLHDNQLTALPPLVHLLCLEDLRLDRNPDLSQLPSLPRSLRTLHLDGCTSLPGTIEDPTALPRVVLELHDVLNDCQLPMRDKDGDVRHMGYFFGLPLPPPALK